MSGMVGCEVSCDGFGDVVETPLVVIPAAALKAFAVDVAVGATTADAEELEANNGELKENGVLLEAVAPKPENDPKVDPKGFGADSSVVPTPGPGAVVVPILALLGRARIFRSASADSSALWNPFCSSVSSSSS